MSFFRSTAIYGKSFKKVSENNCYSIKIYTGGLAGRQTAQNRVEVEIDRFISDSKYKSYEILSCVRSWFWFSGFRFIIKFTAKTGSLNG